MRRHRVVKSHPSTAHRGPAHRGKLGDRQGRYTNAWESPALMHAGAASWEQTVITLERWVTDRGVRTPPPPPPPPPAYAPPRTRARTPKLSDSNPKLVLSRTRTCLLQTGAIHPLKPLSVFVLPRVGNSSLDQAAGGGASCVLQCYDMLAAGPPSGHADPRCPVGCPNLEF